MGNVRMAIAVLSIAFAAHATMLPAAALDSPWWRGDRAVILGYGCTAITLEPVDARFSCPAVASHVHEAIDIDLAFGTPLYAGRPGVVSAVGAPGSDRHDYGPNYIRIWLDEGPDVLLGHLSRAVVKVGDRVTVGTLLGYSGDLGETDVPNLDFSVRPHGTAASDSLDPRPFLDFSPALTGRAGARYIAAWSSSDGGVHARRAEGGPWTLLPGGPDAGFAAHLLTGYDGAGHAFVLGAAVDGGLWQDVEADAPAPAGTWAGWRPVGSSPAPGLVAPALTAVAPDGRLRVDALGADGKAWTSEQTTTAGVWSAWTPGPLVAPPAPSTLHTDRSPRRRAH